MTKPPARSKPRPRPTPSSLPTDQGKIRLTEEGLALEFTRRHAGELAYVHQWGQWQVYDGTRWAKEPTLLHLSLARKLVQEIGARVPDRQADRTERAATSNAIASLARADRAHARRSDDFDREPMLLNTPAGTIDLETGILRPHRRADMITKVTPIAPSSEPPKLWLDCLATWTNNDDELVDFLQRFCGYCLTGSVREEILAIVYGVGGNGKTKFLEVLRGCLGDDYETGVDMATLVESRYDQHPTALASLKGKRLAVAVETQAGRRLNETKVKTLTGGDRIPARFMRQDFFDFTPSHKLLIVGNHRPELRDVDEAWRRRMLLIPFEAVIPPERRDKRLAEKLRRELPSILGWMIAGARLWQERGLDPPARVLAATDDYLKNADPVARWLEECCDRGANLSLSKTGAFDSWSRWTEAGGEYAGTKRRFIERVGRLPGVDEDRDREARLFIGIGLKGLA